jgi:hypothetical protein
MTAPQVITATPELMQSGAYHTKSNQYLFRMCWDDDLGRSSFRDQRRQAFGVERQLADLTNSGPVITLFALTAPELADMRRRTGLYFNGSASCARHAEVLRLLHAEQGGTGDASAWN